MVMSTREPARSARSGRRARVGVWSEPSTACWRARPRGCRDRPAQAPGHRAQRHAVVAALKNAPTEDHELPRRGRDVNAISPASDAGRGVAVGEGTLICDARRRSLKLNAVAPPRFRFRARRARSGVVWFCFPSFNTVGSIAHIAREPPPRRPHVSAYRDSTRPPPGKEPTNRSHRERALRERGEEGVRARWRRQLRARGPPACRVPYDGERAPIGDACTPPPPPPSHLVRRFPRPHAPGCCTRRQSTL